MKYKQSMKRKEIFKSVVPALFCLLLMLHGFTAYGQIRDRVVAFIDTTAITLSELEAKYADTAKITPNITREEVLNTLINRELLLREARKIRLEAPSEDEQLKEYVDLKIKAFIRIREEEIKAFHDGHIGNFEGREFDEVRDDIENYLIEKELNQRLKSHINELRDNACIKLQMKQDIHK